MRRPYSGVVAAVAGLHFAYLCYVPAGGFVALRWPRTIVLHVPAVAWGVAVVGFNLRCPLTALESWARGRAEMEPLPAAGFVDRYVEGRLIPRGRTGGAQALAFIAAALSWIILAQRRFRVRPGQSDAG
ncbi:DUF2784 domain-containing protein [Mycobacterium parmense]|uniref:Uncharacterized protein n=1 Tax=Mycobacterium parmense TaxID=185642 RepID=A0A7I7YWM5_9MYCO|nr:DUF2784 domain-containing protein [Mycobacterium parmense]MCV7351402.1 DUF2784 domain-containing protein [Mycobacterium parmense]ORW60915.1 hypothetical protein AWC20_08290 [Mycobacterium parmense]BBZ45141.1 hypothetical protein MPRM_24220 [Mycobacterium parmense]